MDYSNLTLEQIDIIIEELNKRREELRKVEGEELQGRFKALLKEIFDKGYSIYDEDTDEVINMYYLDTIRIK